MFTAPLSSSAPRSAPRAGSWSVFSMLAFALTALFLLLLLQAWLGWRLAGPFPAAVARWSWGMQVAFTVALPLGMVLSRAGSGRLAVTVAAGAFVAMGLWSILVAGMLGWEVLRWGGAGLDLAARGLGLPGPGALLPADPVLRAVWARAGVLVVVGAALLLTVGAVISDRAPPRVVPITITRPGLPADLESLRIALISDLHVGPTARRAFVAGVVEQVNALQPDLIACTGDLADGSVSALAAEVAPLAALQAPLGVWFVTGNHEYFSGAEEWLAEVERLGMIPLVNEHRALTRGEARLLVAGVPDHTAGRLLPGHSPDARAALAGAPAADFTLMLAHQPRDAHACADAGADLILAGHTHGGQFFPWTALIRLIEPWIAGRYRLGGTDLYVTPGTGTWGPPMRLGTRKEITLITLQSG